MQRGENGAFGRVGAALAWGFLALAAGCSDPKPVEVPRQTGVTLEGNTVVWTTTEPTLGAVRFGQRPAQYDRVSYPNAALREDKRFSRDHRVPLLSVAVGDTIYLQVLDEAPGGAMTASPEFRFAVGSRSATPPLLSWTMIDVGFGDAHLLTMPTTHKRILIDAGERRDWPNVDLFLRAHSIERLDAVLATHIHEDHIGGMVGESFAPNDGVLGAYPVGEFLDAPQHSAARQAYDELLGLLDARGIPRRVVSAGETDAVQPALAWDPEVGVETLNAGEGGSIGGETENDRINNDSIVLRTTYGEVQFMLGGDAESPVQSRLLAGSIPLDSEVLKVHHHGVDDSSDPAYLSAVNPRVGLIPITSFESNSGTLPSSVVLGRLDQRHVDVYASDRAESLGLALHGDVGVHVTVVTDGSSYEVGIRPSSSRHYAGEGVASASNAGSSMDAAGSPRKGLVR